MHVDCRQPLGALSVWAPGQLGELMEVRSRSCLDSGGLEQRISERAQLFAAQGFGPGDYALVLHGGGIDFLVDLLAVWRCGAAAACLNPESTLHERDTVRTVLAPRLILDADRSVAIDADAAALARGARADDDALLLFTSGTSGTPKAVIHSFRSLEARFALNRSYIPAQALSVSLCVLPTHFGHGLIGNLLTPLLGGARVLLWPTPIIPELPQLARIIDEEGVCFFSSVPAFWRILQRLGAPAPGSGCLQRVQVGSAPLSSELWAWIVEWAGTPDVVNMYGITETANWIAGASWTDGGRADNQVGSLWGGSAAVLTGTGALASHGAGEILLRTPSVMRGYFAQEALTEAAFHQGWFRTGDLGTIAGNGTITLTGRVKSEINRGGVKIAPEEIDLLLERCPHVLQACCFGFEDAVVGERVGVALVPDREPFDLDAVRDWARSQLVADKLPDRWFVVDAIPLTDRGKVLRSQVAQMCLSERQP